MQNSIDDKIKELEIQIQSEKEKFAQLKREVDLKSQQLMSIDRECFRLASQIQILKEMRSKNV